MNADSCNTGELGHLIDQALAALGRAMEETGAAVDLANRVQAALQTGFETPVEPPLNRPQNRDEILAAHLRSHRPGTLGKIASDPELEAFIRARIDTLTLKETVAAVTAAFPPDRHVSISAVNRWWLRTCKPLIAPRP